MVPRAPMSVKVSYPQIRWHHVSWEGWHASHALDVRLVCNVVLGGSRAGYRARRRSRVRNMLANGL